MDELLKFIDYELPSDGEWWNYENAVTYMEVARELLVKGLSVDEIKELLSNLYSATAGEFGS